MLQSDFFLLVAREDARALRLTKLLQRFGVARRVDDPETARTLLSCRANWSGLIVDLDEPGAQQRETLLGLRAAHPDVRLLALASQQSGDWLDALRTVHGRLLLKPAADRDILSFARRALISGWHPDERVATYVDVLAQARHLTPREVQLLAYQLRDDSRAQIRRRLGVTVNTMKTHVRSLLRKCQARSMSDLAANVLSQALASDRALASPVEAAAQQPQVGPLRHQPALSRPLASIQRPQQRQPTALQTDDPVGHHALNRAVPWREAAL